MGRRALVIQHDHVSPPGPVGERLTDRGYDVTELLVVPEDRFHLPDVTCPFPDAADWDVIVPMGAPWSADDHTRIGTWLGPELELLRSAHRTGVPVLGICFGGQALACALGGGVERAPRPEIGWVRVESDDPSLVAEGPWFQFHYDRWRRPRDAREVARNDVASQAFVLGRSLAVQFHPELTSGMLEGWLALDGDVQVRAVGQDPDELLERTRRQDAAARERAHRLVDAFLDRVATGTASGEGAGTGDAGVSRRAAR